jgi:hypothetical protein
MAQRNTLSQRNRVTGVSGFSHPSERAARSSVRLLLLVPFIGVLWAPSAENLEPLLGSLPFSTCYLLFWVMISAIVVYVVYRAENEGQTKP